MDYPTPLIPARLVRRYKRFLADCELADGTVVTAHCTNPGAMTGLDMPGLRIWLEPNDDPRKKLKYGWRLAELPGGGWAGVDTGAANKVVAEALAQGLIPELSGYAAIRAEVKYGTASRVDFLLTAPDRSPAYVEVKSVTLRRSGDRAEFPDSVTARGAKHLEELATIARGGGRAVMVYLVQRDDCLRVQLAGDIDPAYVAAFGTAIAAGVEAIAYGTRISRAGVAIGQRLAFNFDQAAKGA